MYELAESRSYFLDGPEIWPLALRVRSQPAGELSVIAPYDGTLIAKVETAGIQHVEQSLKTAYGLFRNRDLWLPLAERIGILERAARIMLREQDSLAKTAAREGGKPLTDSQIEVQRAIDGVKICVEHLRSDTGP